MTIVHHLDDATLMSFAAGSLPNTLAAVAAAHIWMCERCRREVALLERIGAAMVGNLAPASIERKDFALPPASAPPSAPAHSAHGEVPAPLAGIIGPNLDSVRWRWIGPGLWHCPIKVRGAGSLHLLRGAPAASVPEHTHGGGELTLVLRGALIDANGRYGPGDVADIDERTEHHTPSADPDVGCICVIANERPTRFHGWLARLMQPWHGI